MAGFVIRTQTPADDPAVVDIRNRVAPEFPPDTVEEYRHWVDAAPEGTPRGRMVAEEEGRIIGAANFSQMFWTGKPGTFHGGITVDPDRWGAGIGSALYDRLLDAVTTHGATHLYGQYLENVEPAARFVEQRGLKRTGRAHRMSRLEVASANLDGYDGIEERVAAGGIRMSTLADEGVENETLLRAIFELDKASSADAPTSEPQEAMPYETWKQWSLTGPNANPASFFLAMDGERPVGMAQLRRQGDAAWNAYTGVDREYRGRGVARALKLKTIEWSRANGVRWIYTGNDVDNARMLSINVALGYRPLPSSIEVLKEITETG